MTDDELPQSQSTEQAENKPKDIQTDSEKEEKPFVPAPPPSVNVWKVRMQEQKKTAPSAVSNNNSAPQAVKEERSKKQSHKERSKKEKEPKEQKEQKEQKEVRVEKVEQEEDMDAAEGFVKVQSKKATRGGAAAAHGRGGKGSKGAQSGTPTIAPATADKQAPSGKKNRAVADKPTTPVPADKPTGEKAIGSGGAAKAVKSEDDIAVKKPAELRSGPAKVRHSLSTILVKNGT